MKSILTLSLAVLLSAAVSAQAATVTYTSGTLNLNVSADAHNSPPLSVLGTFSDTGTAFQNFTLQQFNSSLGTLQSVQFTINLTVNTTSAVFDVSGVNLLSTITLDRSLTLTITSGAFTNPIGTGTANVSGATLASALGLSLGSVGTDGTLTGPNATAVAGYSTSSYSTVGQLAAVTGAGTLAMSLSATDFYQFITTAAVGSTHWSGTTTYAGTVGVTYTYTAVPEPATTALLVAGGLGALLVCRRQRRAE